MVMVQFVLKIEKMSHIMGPAPILEMARAYVPVKSKLQHSPPGNPPGIWIFGKFVFKFPPPEAEKLFKCSIISPFQVITYPQPRETFGNFYYAPETVYVNVVK